MLENPLFFNKFIVNDKDKPSYFILNLLIWSFNFIANTSNSLAEFAVISVEANCSLDWSEVGNELGINSTVELILQSTVHKINILSLQSE